MSEEPYTKREIDLITKPVMDHLTSQDLILQRIESQTTKTNGRVSKLEWWRGIIIWTFGVVLALSYPIIVLIQHEIHVAVVGVLDQYNIVIK